MLLFLSQITFGQVVGGKLIHGKVIADKIPVEGVNIANLVSERATVTNYNGEFYIWAKPDDLLVFTAVNLEIYRKLIEDEDLKLDVLLIKMIPKITQLKEVIVNAHQEITAESLGIIPYGQKKYTPAERKYVTAASMKMNPMGLDPLINLLSGRTAMLKKELSVEKKEQLLAKIDALFEDKYYVETLKIPADYIRGFQYYCIEKPSFATALRSKNKTMIMFLIVRLAQDYNQIIANEK